MLPQIIANTSNCILIVATLRRQPISVLRGNVPGLHWAYRRAVSMASGLRLWESDAIRIKFIGRHVSALK
jgi:hypothetical protein